MSRRPSLPGADELFRRTNPREGAEGVVEPAPSEPATADAAVRELRAVAVPPSPAPDAGAAPAGEAARTVRPTGRRRGRAADRRPTGRELHEEKITVYVSPEELLDLEHAKLALRGQHGLAVDRGRIVREAIAVIVADLEANGDDSILVRRLRGM